jgi:hypothetical protein
MFALAVGGKAGIRSRRPPDAGEGVVYFLGREMGMKKAAILAVAVGAMTVAIASTAGSAGAQAPEKEPKHLLTFNRAINGAFKVSQQECNRTPGCIAYGVIPEQCHSVFKHKVTCPIHIVTGTPGDQALQQDCHRDVKILIKRDFGLKLFFRFLTGYTCGPNVEHPGFRALEAA